ncbi:survival protein sure-like phosphatase/nucleotidase [Collybia nuda]|uniref:Survival protein sure-like phosphatase/nucleotidase n=1 Tax=Collybia nuda TaxID=64659 RepID=A0A9P5XW92_9AGAR|nr:survival protein sure-like phosphatase/nucleotidase [Collybia nuda]
MRNIAILLVALGLSTHSLQQTIVLTNDDGWAVAQIRAEYDALRAAGFQVVLSAPAENKSGSGSSSAPPSVLAEPCQFDTCPTGLPPEGANATDPFLNYVNSFPVDAVRFGIQTLSPTLLGGRPDFVVSGSNVGNNLGPGITGSGTVGAASEAALEGIPSIAFSGASATAISYTTLISDPTSRGNQAALIYTILTLKFIQALITNPGPISPPRISINVNHASTTNCPTASSFSVILTRICVNAAATDVITCGIDHLPDESSTIRKGCFSTVSVFDATTKTDVGANTQAVVLEKIQSILTCLPA